MEKILKLVARLINGINFASYELETLTYRAEPIKHKQTVIIPNLQKDKATVIDLAGELKFNLLVTGVDADVESDDTETLDSTNAQQSINVDVRLLVNTINRKTGTVVKRLVFDITSYPDYTNEIILEPNYIYEIKPDKNINALTFTGEPVHMRDPIVFLNAVVKDEITSRSNR